MDPRSHLPRAHRRVAWSKDGGLGAEFALVDFGPDDLRADGFGIGFEPEPYRLEFVADVIFDADGLVVDYPGIAARFRGNAPGSPERVTQHAVAFNAAVQSGDWDAFAARFAPDATMHFTGVPAGPFTGRDQIARAYAQRPPAETLTVTEIRSSGEVDTVRFAWASGGTGTMELTWHGQLISRLAVIFDGHLA